MTRAPLLALALGALLIVTSESQAQYQIRGSFHPQPLSSRDGVGYTEWYSYGVGSGLIPYYNPNPGAYSYMNYLDRLDRAEKFGYRRPDLPSGLPRSWGEPHHPRIEIRLFP